MWDHHTTAHNGHTLEGICTLCVQDADRQNGAEYDDVLKEITEIRKQAPDYKAMRYSKKKKKSCKFLINCDGKIILV